jgi:Arc/MetJ-type ribon-helix-helix transcriptional regulator
MTKKKRKWHKPPAQIRYEKNHPQLSIRLTKSLKEFIEQVKGDKSYAAYVQDLLRKKPAELDAEAIKNAVREATEETRKKYQITYLCAGCQKPIVLLPGGKGTEEAIAHLKRNGWMHKGCTEK